MKRYRQKNAKKSPHQEESILMGAMMPLFQVATISIHI